MTKSNNTGAQVNLHWAKKGRGLRSIISPRAPMISDLKSKFWAKKHIALMRKYIEIEKRILDGKEDETRPAMPCSRD